MEASHRKPQDLQPLPSLGMAARALLSWEAGGGPTKRCRSLGHTWARSSVHPVALAVRADTCPVLRAGCQGPAAPSHGCPVAPQPPGERVPRAHPSRPALWPVHPVAHQDWSYSKSHWTGHGGPGWPYPRDVCRQPKKNAGSAGKGGGWSRVPWAVASGEPEPGA